MWTIILIVALVACVLAIFLLVNHPSDDEQLPFYAEDLEDKEVETPSPEDDQAKVEKISEDVNRANP